MRLEDTSSEIQVTPKRNGKEMMTEERLISLIETSLKRTLSPQSLSPQYTEERELSSMFKKNLTVFTSYLENELAPKIEHLQ